MVLLVRHRLPCTLAQPSPLPSLPSRFPFFSPIASDQLSSIYLQWRPSFVLLHAVSSAVPGSLGLAFTGGAIVRSRAAAVAAEEAAGRSDDDAVVADAQGASASAAVDGLVVRRLSEQESAIWAKLREVGLGENVLGCYLGGGNSSLPMVWEKVRFLLEEGMSPEQVSKLFGVRRVYRLVNRSKRASKTASDALVMSPKVDRGFESADVIAIWQKLREIGLEDSSVVRLLSVQNLSLHDIWERIRLLLEQGMPSSKVCRLFRSGSIRIFLDVPYHKQILYVEFLKSVNLTGQSACDLLSQKPIFFTFTIESLEEKVKFFEQLGIRREKLGSRPILLVTSLKKSQQNVDYLLEIGMKTKYVARAVSRYPKFVALNIESDIKPKIAYLDNLGVQREAVYRFFARCPAAMGCRPEAIPEMLSFLEQIGFDRDSLQTIKVCVELSSSRVNSVRARYDLFLDWGFSQDDIKDMVSECPRILGLSTISLGKKLDYLLNVLQRDRQEIREFPECLVFNLEKRIIQRFDALAKNGLNGADLRLSPVIMPAEKDFLKLANSPSLKGRSKKRRSDIVDSSNNFNVKEFVHTATPGIMDHLISYLGLKS